MTLFLLLMIIPFKEENQIFLGTKMTQSCGGVVVHDRFFWMTKHFENFCPKITFRFILTARHCINVCSCYTQKGKDWTHCKQECVIKLRYIYSNIYILTKTKFKFRIQLNFPIDIEDNSNWIFSREFDDFDDLENGTEEWLLFFLFN